MARERFGESEACRHFDAELGAYLEGEARPFVIAHALECRFCEVVLTDLEALRSAGRVIPLEDPSPVIWANVRATLRAEGIIHDPKSGWQRWFGNIGLSHAPAPIGALAGLLVFAVMLLNTSRVPRHTVGPDFASGSGITAAAFGPPGENELERTIQELESSFKSREASFDPSLKAAYKLGLESLNDSIRECSESVRRQPENALAREYLLAAYTQKAEVLETALELDAH